MVASLMDGLRFLRTRRNSSASDLVSRSTGISEKHGSRNFSGRYDAGARPAGDEPLGAGAPSHVRVGFNDLKPPALTSSFFLASMVSACLRFASGRNCARYTS